MAGYKVNQRELENRTGYTLEPVADQGGVSPMGGIGFNRRGQGVAQVVLNKSAVDEVAALAKALQLDLGPAAEAVQAFLEAPTQAGAAHLLEQLPQLVPEDPASTEVLADVITRAYEEALAEQSGKYDRPIVQNAQHRGGNPENRGQFSKTEGSHHPGTNKKERKTESKRDRFGTTDIDKLSNDPELNANRCNRVVTWAAAKEGRFEPHACYRKDVGWIGIDYGTPGNPDNEWAGGYGVSHILAKHHAAIDKLTDIMKYGNCYKHNKNKNKAYLLYKDSVVVLSKNSTGMLLITDYDRLTDKQIDYVKSKGIYHIRGNN